MGTQKNLIELNGKKYDTVTGKVISTSTSSVEGFMPAAHHPHHAPKHAAKSRASGPAAKGIHHRTTKSRTLMRGAVHRPPITAIQGTIDHIAQVHRNTHVVGDHKRAQRAKQVPKSSHIQRFGSGTGTDLNGTFTSRTAVLPVKSAPESPKVPPVSAVKPVTTKAAAAASPVTKTAFTKELEQAQSHTQPKAKAPKNRVHHRAARKLHLKPRTLSLVAGTAVVVLLAGFFGYQYRAYASVKVAATRSGVNAALPASPAGFALSDTVHYKSGVVTLDYKSNTDGRNFTVTQANSNWNSDALAENFIAQLPPPHSSTLYPNGKTVFTYGSDGNNATWVSGGIWYKVEGNSALTSNQLQGIINSL